LKILQICHRVPYPAIDGGNIAMMNMALSLENAGHELHQFALNTKKHFVRTEEVPVALKNKLHFESAVIDTSVTLPGIILNFFSTNSYNITRFYSKDVEEQILSRVRSESFDIIQLETLYAAPYIDCIKKNSKAKIVLRAHNVEHIIWQRLVKKEKNIFKKKYLGFLARRLRKFEFETLKKIDALVPITSVDEKFFLKMHYRGPVLTVPVSIDINDYPFIKSAQSEISLFHLGSMDWLPNREAIEWFLDNCWPVLHKLFPALKLFLAGRSFPQEIIDCNHPNVICEGRIENANSYMQNKQIMIVPLHSGSGMRVKIIQGMALGKTIISTSIGAEGIPATNRLNILIADSPEEFISTIKSCIDNFQQCREIGANARKFIEEHYSNEAVGRQLGIFYKALLKLR
jgi:glycosyltransferase involved in cell wall biosynthesis